MKNHSRNNCVNVMQKSARRGTAQMELALFLPLYAAFIMMLFTIFSFARTRSEVAVTARYEAWSQRDFIGDQTDTLEVETGHAATIGKILNNEQDPTLGLVNAKSDKKATLWSRSMNLVTNLSSSHYVMTDPWDHRVIEFKDKSDHKRLTLDKRVVVFGRFDTSVFRSLASFFGGSNAGNMNQLAASRQQAIAQFQADREKLNQAIDRLSSQIDGLKRELRELQSEEPVDEDKVVQIQRSIRARSNELSRYENQLDKLNSARAFLF